ncbi:PREDICTED: meckelin-like [Amphimedon queenslandica]|uniref:Uncharacterized protein n=2 Tax=Amphimedon queenslandica TaxID=400682 RepID=A0AAN0JZ53_AMPQE|nr:PREDICTED: meckelin-like [Amphimedon queenslandica]|eukprot:XP_019862280.1 PREDICTED: meckelin-like [Amphimedon queenslandica]
MSSQLNRIWVWDNHVGDGSKSKHGGEFITKTNHSPGMIHTVLVVLVLVSLGSPQSNVSPIDFNTPQSCSHDTQYFYPGNLSCISCPPNSVTSSNGLSCNCVTGYRQTSNIGPVTCEACPNLSSVRSDDGLYCLTCLSPLIYTGGTCTGCEDQTSIFVDTIPINRSSTGDRRCQTCPVSTIADSSKKLCIPCGISNCSNCLSFTNGVCFTQPLTPPTSTPFPFYSNFSSSLALCNVRIECLVSF